MSKKLIKAAEFKSQKVSFSDNIRTNKYSGKSVYINYEGSPLRVQMPKMSLPFGISCFKKPDDPSQVSYNLELSFRDVDGEIINNFKNLEEKIIDFAEKNSKELFKKQKSREVLKDSYSSFLKIDLDEDGNESTKYAPRMKVKIYTQGINFNFDAYDAEKKDGKYPKLHITEDNYEEFIGKGSQCEVIIQCNGIWVIGGNKFGVSWSLSQMKVYKNDNKLVGYSFIEDEEILEEEVIEEETLDEPEEVVEEVEEKEPDTKERKPRSRKREYL